MRYTLACLSDAGTVRRHNEDNFAFFGNVMPAEHQASGVLTADVHGGGPFAVGVFDGIGGGVAGESASFAAAQAFNQYAGQGAWSDDAMLEVLAAMEEAVCAERDRQRACTMGTTAVLLAVQDEHASVANVGDSPAILIRDGKARTLSRDHTNAETLRLLGITDRKPGLTQFLGMSDGDVAPSPHVVSLDLEPGCAILLASDGLTGYASEVEIADITSAPGSTAGKAEKLRDLALENGSTDNITVLLCEVSNPVHRTKDVA